MDLASEIIMSSGKSTSGDAEQQIPLFATDPNQKTGRAEIPGEVKTLAPEVWHQLRIPGLENMPLPL